MSDSRPPRPQGAPRPFGISRPSFGLAKETPHRIELHFALKGGTSISTHHDLGDEVSEASFKEFVEQLQEQVRGGTGIATFADSWSDTGQRTWVDLSQVSGFSVRPVR